MPTTAGGVVTPVLEPLHDSISRCVRRRLNDGSSFAVPQFESEEGYDSASTFQQPLVEPTAVAWAGRCVRRRLNDGSWFSIAREEALGDDEETEADSEDGTELQESTATNGRADPLVEPTAVAWAGRCVRRRLNDGSWVSIAREEALGGDEETEADSEDGTELQESTATNGRADPLVEPTAVAWAGRCVRRRLNDGSWVSIAREEALGDDEETEADSEERQEMQAITQEEAFGGEELTEFDSDDGTEFQEPTITGATEEEVESMASNVDLASLEFLLYGSEKQGDSDYFQTNQMEDDAGFDEEHPIECPFIKVPIRRSARLATKGTKSMGSVYIKGLRRSVRLLGTAF